MNVIGLSHTGHLYDDNIESWEPINVADQINDKVKYVEKYLIDQSGELYFIGHSVGCHVIVETLAILEENHKSKVKKAFLLFPTIERMRETPNGKILTFSTSYFLWFIYFVAYMLTLLPKSVQTWLVDLFFSKHHSSKDMHDKLDEVALRLSTKFSCVRSCLHMAHDEMHQVRHLNRRSIEQNQERILLYYGAQDRWCPVDYYYDMKRLIDSINENKIDKTNMVMLDNHGLDHAFVIYKKQTTIVSDMVAEWIQNL